MATSIGILRTNTMISNDDRRISQQSIPSLSTTSTDTTTTSIESSRPPPKNASPPLRPRRKASRSSSPPQGYIYHHPKNELSWPMYQHAAVAYSPFMPAMYGQCPLNNFHEQSMTNYKHSSSPPKRRYMDVYEPILPVPLAATMEANMSNLDGFDYEDNVPLAYFKRMASVTNKPLSPKRSSQTSIETPSPRRTRRDMQRQSTMEGLASAATLMKTEETSLKTAGSKTAKSTVRENSKPVTPVPQSKKNTVKASNYNEAKSSDYHTAKSSDYHTAKSSDYHTAKSSHYTTAKTNNDKSSDTSSISSSKWIARFRAGIARIRIKTLKN